MDWKVVKPLTNFSHRSFSVNVLEYRNDHVDTKLIEIQSNIDSGRIVLGEHDLKQMLKDLTECT